MKMMPLAVFANQWQEGCHNGGDNPADAENPTTPPTEIQSGFVRFNALHRRTLAAV
jgi:hypothetical protein